MDHLKQILNQGDYSHELLYAEINDLVEQLLKIYKTTENIADQQYIFAKFKEILTMSREKKMYDIRKVILRAIAEITTV